MPHGRITAVVLVLHLAGCAQTVRSPAQAPPAEVREPSLFSYPWTWLDERGAEVAFSRWRGTPLVVAAIYTTCFETCPRTLVRLRRVYDEYVRTRRSAQFVVVTMDPAIDTQQRLLQFKAARGLPEAWRLLTGSRQATEELLDVLNINIMDMGTHLVHDSKITAFDAQGMRVSTLDVR